MAGAEKKPKATPKAKKAQTPSKVATVTSSISNTSTAPASVGGPGDVNKTDLMHKDNSFREFRRLCAEIANASSYLTKTSIVRDFFNKGTDGGEYKFVVFF